MKTRSLGFRFLWMTGAAMSAVGLLFGAIGWMVTKEHDLNVAQQQISADQQSLIRGLDNIDSMTTDAVHTGMHVLIDQGLRTGTRRSPVQPLWPVAPCPICAWDQLRRT